MTRTTISPLFTRIYWGGFLLTLSLLGIAWFAPNSPTNSLVSPGSVVHMFALCIVGYKAANKKRAGESVQLMGFLHTYSNFCLGLLVFSTAPSGQETNVLLHFVGSAIFTSIVGWFFGDDLQRRHPQPLDNLDVQLERTIACFDALTSAIQTLERHMHQVGRESTKFCAALDTLEHNVRTSGGALSNTLVSHANQLGREVGALHQVTQLAAKEMRAIETHAGVASQAFSQSHKLVESTSNLIDFVARTKAKNT